MKKSQDYDPDEDQFYKLYLLRDKETKFLADLTGIDMDLTRTVNFCKALLKLTLNNANKEGEHVLIDALATAALIKYSRCFTKAVRNQVPTKFMDSLPEELRKKHKYFIKLRNKHTAHSANVFEDNSVLLEVQEDANGGKKLRGITMDGSWIEGLGFKNILDLINLCEKLLLRIRKEIFEEKRRLLEFYKSKDIENVLNSTIERPPFPSDKDVEKRKQWI